MGRKERAVFYVIGYRTDRDIATANIAFIILLSTFLIFFYEVDDYYCCMKIVRISVVSHKTDKATTTTKSFSRLIQLLNFLFNVLLIENMHQKTEL